MNVKSGLTGLLFMFLVLPITASASFDTSLKYGMRGASVLELQEFLTDQGFYNGPISGNFFSLTLAGVKKFQLANNLPSTGYFGPLSRNVANLLLNDLTASSTTEEVVETGTTTVIIPVTHYPVYGTITPTQPQTPIIQPVNNQSIIMPQTVSLTQSDPDILANPGAVNDVNPWFTLSSDNKFTIKKLVFQVDEAYNPDNYTVVGLTVQGFPIFSNGNTVAQDFILTGQKDVNSKVAVTGDVTIKNTRTMRLSYGREGSAKSPEAELKGFKVTLLGSESVVIGQDGSQLVLPDLVLVTK